MDVFQTYYKHVVMFMRISVILLKFDGHEWLHPAGGLKIMVQRSAFGTFCCCSYVMATVVRQSLSTESYCLTVWWGLPSWLCRRRRPGTAADGTTQQIEWSANLETCHRLRFEAVASVLCM